jgi:hypothetical protein
MTDALKKAQVLKGIKETWIKQFGPQHSQIIDKAVVSLSLKKYLSN